VAYGAHFNSILMFSLRSVRFSYTQYANSLASIHSLARNNLRKDLRCSGMLRSVCWTFLAEVSGQVTCPIFIYQELRWDQQKLRNIPEVRRSHKIRVENLKSSR